MPRITACTNQSAGNYSSDDEGMGDSDEEIDMLVDSVDDAKRTLTALHAVSPSYKRMWPNRIQHSTSSTIRSAQDTSQGTSTSKPDYKLLHQTHVKLRHRFLTSSYRLCTLQTRGGPDNAHTNTIYCLQLYTYPKTGKQVLFTGSRDKSVREWNLNTGMVERVITNVHSRSVLSICVHNGYLASAGGDRQVALWHLESNQLVRVIHDHEDSILCVRFDDRKLVSCSKGVFHFFSALRHQLADVDFFFF